MSGIVNSRSIGRFFIYLQFFLENAAVRVVIPFSPGKNGYRKNDYIVDYPDLIEPLFPHSHFRAPIYPLTPTNGKFGIAVCIFLKKKESEPNGTAIFLHNKLH